MMKPNLSSVLAAKLMSVCLFSANLIAFPAMAQSTQGVLVELFTSQGCSSCPPADAFLADLTQDQGVIPLALHVDYWDYIGWNDTFAQEKFTKRQRKYAKMNADRMVYTPQMIVAGQIRVKGHDTASVMSGIASVKSPITLTLTRHGDDVLITATSDQPLPGDILVDLVRYYPKMTVQIERGENRGQAISYHNIVTSWMNVGEWTGKSPLALTTRATGDDPIVVILQQEGPGAVLASAVLK
jgi:hypothetical protein